MPGRSSVIQLHRTDGVYTIPFGTARIVRAASVRKTGRVLIADEAVRAGGFGAELAALVAEHAFFDLDAPVRRVTGLDVPLPHSRPLETAALPSVASIAAGLRAARA